MRIPSGSTDRYIFFVAVDATDLKSRETGMTGWVVWYSNNGGNATQMASPTINETSSSNMPGVYELLIDEAGMTSIGLGEDTAELCLHIIDGSSAMAPVTRVIEIFRAKITAGRTLGVAADGDISGNIDGSVASVSGAVGSVSGAVGSVTGAVGSVTAAVETDATSRTESKADVTNLDAAITTRSSHAANDTRDAILSDSTPFAGANINNLPSGVKKNTALSNFAFAMYDSTDTKSPKTGLTVTVQRSIDGTAFGDAANTPATEISAGAYEIDLVAGDLNGDVIILKFTASGGVTRFCTVVTDP